MLNRVTLFIVLGVLGGLASAWLLSPATSLPEPSPDQVQTVSDGRVSYEEYSRAVEKTLDCLEGSGLEVDGPHPGGARNRELRYSYWFPEPGRTLEETGKTHDACYERHLGLIDSAYVTQLYGSGNQQELAECLRTLLDEDVSALQDSEVIENALRYADSQAVAKCIPTAKIP